MKIVYYTSGTVGIGRIVHGLSIYNAFARKKINCNFTILSSAPAERVHVMDKLNVPHIEIPQEKFNGLSEENYHNSKLFKTLDELKPDILLIDRMWFTLYNFIKELKCKKIYLTLQVIDSFYTLDMPGIKLSFNKGQYDKIIAIEPYKAPMKTEHINPIVIRNRNEILGRQTALNELGLDGKRKACLVALNFKEGYFDKLKMKYSRLKGEGYDMVYTTNLMGEGIFPVADYYNAIDLIVSAATYNQFWETRFFNKEAVFETVPVQFCNQAKRIRECSDYEFDINGADQLVDILVNL